jgi:L-cystine uptake protein TcyP (sodium:dicarboxylate symporter family)
MVILGLVLIALGGLAIVTAVFATDNDNGQLAYLSIDVSPLVLFLIGVAAAVAILWGLSITKWGGKRSWARRREEKRLTELSEKLDTVDARRRMDVDEAEDRDRPTL